VGLGLLVLATVVVLGCAPPPPGPRITGPTVVEFTPRTPFGKYTQIIFITNEGDADTPISVRAVVRDNSPGLTSRCPGVLAAGQRCQIDLVVSRAAAVQGTIWIDTPEGTALTITLTGGT
jgi:hypothetical protein